MRSRRRTYDAGLLAAVDYWRQKVGNSGATASGSGAAAGAAAGSASRAAAERRSPIASRRIRAHNLNRRPVPARPTRRPPPVPQRQGFGFGRLLVWGILIFLGFMLLRRLLAGRRQQQ